MGTLRSAYNRIIYFTVESILKNRSQLIIIFITVLKKRFLDVKEPIRICYGQIIDELARLKVKEFKIRPRFILFVTISSLSLIRLTKQCLYLYQRTSLAHFVCQPRLDLCSLAVSHSSLNFKEEIRSLQIDGDSL